MLPRLATLAALLLLVPRCAGGGATAPRPRDTPTDASATTPSARYLSLGDSFTIGTGSSPERSFAARLSARWRSSGCAVEHRNPAVNGYTTDDLLRDEVPVARAFAPTVVTLAIGANDLVRGRSVAQYRAQLTRVFAELSSAGVNPLRVTCIPQPDWSRAPIAEAFGDRDATRERIATFNSAMREECSRAGARWADLDALMRRQAEAAMFAPDGLHPSAEAHDEWAEALSRAMPSPCAR